MEEELKRNAGSGQPAIDADMALAMGGQLVATLLPPSLFAKQIIMLISDPRERC